MYIESIALAFTALAAGGAWYAAWQTRKAALGHMLIELSRQYGSNEMLKSMKVLRKWRLK